MVVVRILRVSAADAHGGAGAGAMESRARAASVARPAYRPELRGHTIRVRLIPAHVVPLGECGNAHRDAPLGPWGLTTSEWTAGLPR
jgi:hypothetical protein